MKLEEMGKYRPQICDIISEMLDNPNEYGIYPTSVAYKKLDDLIDSAKEALLSQLKGEIDGLKRKNILRMTESEKALVDDIKNLLENL